jgi:outer membrane biosynthesis protein TonB
MSNLAETDRRWSLTGTLLFHATLVGLLFLIKCGNGGGGGNGGLGYTGLMSLDAAGIGTMVDGEGYVPMPESVMEEPAPEAVEETNAITDDSSQDSPTISDKKQSENKKSDTQVRKDNTQQQQTQQQVSNNLNNAFNNIKGGSGTTTGTGQQGDPNGSINGRGVLGGGGSAGTGGGSGGGNGTGVGVGSGSGSGMSWSLSGRTLLNTPKVNGTAPDEGTVSVDIWVDANGNVTKAIANAAKSNTSNGTLFKMAEDAALKAKFNGSSSGNEQKGSIKITFKLH